jgi:hypothetical protein
VTTENRMKAIRERIEAVRSGMPATLTDVAMRGFLAATRALKKHAPNDLLFVLEQYDALAKIIAQAEDCCSQHERCMWAICLESSRNNYDTAVRRMQTAEAEVVRLTAELKTIATLAEAQKHARRKKQ